jgi:hypothetical protein
VDKYLLLRFDGNLRVVVETPRGSQAKLDYSKSLLTGLSYPYDWGFIPATRACWVCFDGETWREINRAEFSMAGRPMDEATFYKTYRRGVPPLPSGAFSDPRSRMSGIGRHQVDFGLDR